MCSTNTGVFTYLHICTIQLLRCFVIGKRRNIVDDLLHEALTVSEYMPHEVFQMDNNDTPQDFDLEGHLATIRRSRHKRQIGNKRYVLLILDSSGSITAASFNSTVKILSNLAPLFCGNALFAVMTYDSIIEQHMCFESCDQLDRIKGSLIAGHKLWKAISCIPYRNGPSTRSGDAIRCACDNMLHHTCGFENEPNSVIDVIFLTDGRSNMGENVCSATKCLNRFSKKRVNVVTIGIGSFIDYTELDCIKGDLGASSHIFDVTNIAGLEVLQEEVVRHLNATQRDCRQCCNPL